MTDSRQTMEILEARARDAARRQRADEIEDDVLRLLSFSSSSESFGIEAGYVQEVQPLEERNWSLVPCTPDFIMGAVTIRGRIYSMMDVGRFLRIPHGSLSGRQHVLLVRAMETRDDDPLEFCIVADGMPEIRMLSKEGLQPPSATVSAEVQDYIRGVTEDMLMVLNMDAILSDPEIIVDDEG